MVSAKDILVKPISSKNARMLIKSLHYSGKVVNNSSLHLGVFLHDNCEGVLQFGPSMMKKQMVGHVTGTKWNGFLELNRMAFSEKLPRNSESRALAVSFKLIKKHYPHIKWVITFADGTQCGDGTIYRASGFKLLAVKPNRSIRINPSNGEQIQSIAAYLKGITSKEFSKMKPIPGFQMKYIYFIDKSCEKNLTLPILPFSEIDRVGAGMYKGQKRRVKQAIVDIPINSGGATPTDTLQENKGT